MGGTKREGGRAGGLDKEGRSRRGKGGDLAKGSQIHEILTKHCTLVCQ